MIDAFRDFIARQALDTLWALVWHFGIIGAILFAALAWAWFMKPFMTKTALWVALGAALILVTASVYTDLGAKYVQAKWDAAKSADAAAAERARAQAEKDTPPVVAGEPHAKRVRNDKYDRDNQ